MTLQKNIQWIFRRNCLRKFRRQSDAILKNTAEGLTHEISDRLPEGNAKEIT